MAKRRGQGEGSIYQREDGGWVAQLDLGYVAGKRSRPVRRARTKREALAKLEEMKRDRDAGITSTAKNVEQWLAYWLDEVIAPAVEAGDLKPATARYYRSHVEQWLTPHLGAHRLNELAPRHVRELHAAMRKAGKSDAMIRNSHATLRKAMKVALSDGRLRRDPLAGVSAPTPKDRYRILTAEQAGVLFACASADPRTLARVHVAILGGLRQGEALALRWEDVTDTHISVKTSITRVDGKLTHVTPKTRAGVREVPMAPALKASLEAWRERSVTGYVFHGFRGPEAIEGAERDHRAWKAALEAAKLPAVPLHGARGTCATLLQAAGVPPRVVADILGQANVVVALEHYSHSDDGQRTDALGKLAEQI